MAYRHSIKKRSSKSRAKTRQMDHRMLLASLAMAAGIFAYPFGGEASTITPKDAGDAAKITQIGNVYNIDPQKESGTFAYNRFSAFILDAGHIANLKFGGADALANLVNSRIDINGTVNAIKNNAIGGHLYFLSPDGIAVGATGVINAGQFTGIVPTRTAFETLYNAANITLDQVNALRDGSYATVKTDAEGKTTGTIDVSGHINTHSGVMLGAGVININDGAKLQSVQNINFTDLVNTGSASAGLNNLTASTGTGGDIILTAKQTSDVKDTKIEKDENNQDKEVANAIRWSDRSTDLNAAVNIGKDATEKGVAITSSDGAVKISAESASNYEDSTPMTLTDTLKDVIFGSEKTAIDGLIDKLAKKEAGANQYLFVNYSNKKNKASVNIGENSAITGKNIDVSATSTVDIKQSVAVPAGEGKKDSNGKEVSGSAVMAAVAISRVYNSADVVVDGNLIADGADANGNGITIAANADTKAALSATAAGGANTKTAAGVAVLSGDTKSKVTVNEGETALTAAQGKVSVDATTTSNVDVKANAVGGGSYVVSNVGVANYDTSADVIINRSINAGAVDVKAENTAAGFKMTVDNTAESGTSQGKDTQESTEEQKQKDNQDATTEKNKGNAGKSQDEQNSEQKSIDPTKVVKDANADTNDNKTKDATGTDGKGGVQDVVDKVNGTNNGGDNGAKTSAFGLGAAVGVVSNTNTANVTIGKNAAITAVKPNGGAEAADGSVNVSANTLMQSSAEKEDGFAFSVKNALANAKVEIGAAVLVSNVKNDAAVLMDSDGTNFAQIKGDGKAALNAAAGMGTYKDNEDKDKTSALSYAASAENKSGEETPTNVSLSGSVGVNTLKNNAVVLLGQKGKVEGAEVSLSSDAAANAAGTYGIENENNKVAVGGTVGIQNISNSSLVMAGKESELIAAGEDKSVEAKANNSLDVKNNVKNAGKGDSFGISGMVALSYGDSNSIVSLDDEAKIKADSVSIASENSTNVDNSARKDLKNGEGSKAFGIGVGIVNYDVNSIAMVADNGAIDATGKPADDASDKDKAAWKINADALLARSVAGDALAGKLGGKTADGAKGSITTGDLDMSSTTTGMIQNDAKAKSAPEDKENGTEAAGNKKTEKWTNWSKQGQAGADEARTDARNLEQDNVTSQNESAAPSASSQNGNAAPSASGAAQEAASAANPDETPTNGGAAPAAGSSGSAGASIGVEGSAALTFLGGRTDAVLDNVTVKSGTDPASLAGLVDSVSVSLDATDFLGSITLGGTTTKNSLQTGSATKVGIGGTFAMNSVNRDVDSLVRNSTMEQVGYLSNSASKTGIELAAGMGLSTGSGGGTNVSGAGVVYYNKAKQDVHALLIDNTVTSDFISNILGLGMLSNEAVSTDFQIAGGLAASLSSGSGTNVGVGGAVAVSRLENNLSSGIIGGSYTNFATIDVEAQKGTTQINGAAAGGKSGYGFNGAFAYGSTKNKTHAYISDNATVGGDLTGEVNVKAGEVPVVKTSETLSQETTDLGKDKLKVDGKEKLTDKAKTRLKGSLEEDAEESKQNAGKAKENENALKDKGIDPTGKDYLVDGTAGSSLDSGAAGTDAGAAADEAAGDENEAKGLLGQNHSVTITAAMAGGLSSDVGAGAGIAYNYVKNDIAADIKDSTITADSINGEASSDSLIVSVGAGVAVGGKTFNGAGSGSWNDLKNDTKVTFADNTINGNKISAQADNASSIINIAGEVAGGKGMAMGLSLAYNSLNNTTGAYLTGNDIDMKNLTGLLEDSNSVKLASSNTGKALAVAGGVNVNISQSAVGAVGTVAINRGVNNTESVIDGKSDGTKTTLDDLKTLSVTASELTKKTTVAGGVSVGGKKVGIGGAVAYTSVGSSKDKERLRAEINNADVTTTETGTITVSTTDSKTKIENNGTTTEKSRITTVGAGIGVGWGKNYFNLQGAAAVSDIYKDSKAALNNTSINAKKTDLEDYTDRHPAISVTADTKSKINTVGAVGDISITGKVTGTVGLAINRMDQDTKAEMATDSGTTAVNAGRTEVRAVGDADIHSVGVGGTVSVSEFVGVAGSGSYNYIGNDVDALIKNQNLKSNNSVGVVARSDDRLYNFAGGFTIGANTKAALSTAVGINKITGNTNALVQGGSIAASDGDAIKVSRPDTDKIFKAEELNVAVERNGLAGSRADVDKTGIVVDSSATHTVISQMASGGVAASASVGVNLAGTVNLNTIEGKTTAKTQDADLNTADNASDVNVNAVDYTNIGSFTGTPSVGAAATAGVSLGVSTDWETYDRTTEAEISASSAKKNVYAKNLTVDALSKHGSSALSFAASAGAAATAGVASGDSIMRHVNTSTTGALVENVKAEFDGAAEVKAENLGNSHSQNISVSAAGGYVAVAAGAGVSVMDDTSKVTSEVKDSDLKAKTSEAGKNISVLAKNENNWKNTLVTASLAVGIGGALAANVGVNNTSGETAALVTNSNLEAYDVAVKAEDKLTVKSTGGVGAGGLGGVGVAVALNNINSSTSAHVTGGSVKASHDIDVAAQETRSFDGAVTGASAGGVGVGVNVAVTSINKGITDAQLSSAKDENGNPMGSKDGTNVDATTKENINKHLASVNNAKGALGVSGAKFFGMNATDKKNLNTATNTSVSLSSPKYASNTPDTRKQGVHTEVAGVDSLSAGNVVNVTALDTSDIFAKNVGVTAAGAASVNVTDNIIHTNYDTDVTVSNASIEGKNVNISALQTQAAAQDGKQGSDVRVTAVTVGALGGVGVGYAGIVNKGATDVNIANSTIKGTDSVAVNALDESKHKSQILSVGVAAANVTTTFASVENKSNVGVTLSGTNNISAGKDITIEAKRANTLEANTQGVGVGGVNVAVNHATIVDGEKDKNGNIVAGIAAAKITGTTNVTGATETSGANKFHLGAVNDATAKLGAGNTAVSVLGISTMRGKGVMDMGAEVSVAGGSFNAKTVEFASMLGDKNGRTIEGNVKGHNISVGAVSPDTVQLETTAKGKVNVANSTFGENTDLILDNESHVDRKGYIYDVTVGGVAVGNSRAIISGDETLTTTLTGKSGITNKLNSLQVAAYGENTGKALADAGGGGLVGYVGAHVENKSTNNVTSTLDGNWDVAGEVYLVAGQKDEAKLTASEGHGGVIGVGGTSVDNIINTTTNTTVASGASITADRVHIGTVNTAVTGAYDDTNEKGVKDVQTYTLKDHFGGAIVGNRLRSLLDLTENGTVTIGKNAKITTNNLQEYVAASDNNLTNLASAKGGGAMAVVDAVSENKINVHNTVDVQSGATLSNEKSASKEGIVLSAYDDQSLKSHAESTVGGVANGLVSIIETNMNRTSDVKVAGTIESSNNVGLYAGANATGALSNLNADLKAGTYNYAVFAVTGPQVRYNLTADKGTVNVSGTVRSAGDINAIASGGREEVVKDQSLWNWVNGGSSTEKKFLSSNATTAEEALPKWSTVNVTGSLIAGTADPINLTIGGSVANGLTITADDNDANNRVKNGVTQGTFDYANTLGAQLTKLNELIAAYDGNPTVQAAYITERTRIQNEMKKLGLVDLDENGNVTQYLNSGRSVYYVEIPDIATGGGNINVTANDLIGTGKLHANSAPSITIKNESDAYLKLNNIEMGEQGGKIVYNKDNIIPPGASAGNAKINSVNVRKSGANFREIYGVTTGGAADLSVLNTKTFSGDKTSTIQLTPQLEREIDASDLTAAEKTQYKQDIRAGKLKYTALTDIEVNGKISNAYGNVTIDNASGDIRISGGTQDRPTGVSGTTVRLIAANGSIAQGYKDGIVNINGDPEKYYADQAKSLKDPVYAIYQSSQFQTGSWQTRTTNAERTDNSDEATGYIAGRDVYVSAANINVNGLIQSGYKNYTATVTQDDLDAAKTANEVAVIQNRTMIKVNKGGAKWNDAEKVFDYVPQVYWDPATDKLVVEDIDTAGGKIYLTGKIASTGDGRILAADGAAEITVTNNTTLDMNVGKVLNNQREGVITIADTAADTWTEYKKGQTRTIANYTQHLYDHRNDGDPYASATVTDNNGLSVGTTLTYNPKPNQAYTWIEGATTETAATYEHYERRGFWGLVQTADTTQLKEWEKDSTPVEPAKLRELGLPGGATIDQDFDYHNFFTDEQAQSLNIVNNLDVTKYAQEANQLWLYSQNNVKATWTYGHEHWVTRSGFLGWFKHIHDRWKTGSNTVQFYHYALNASQPITIGLIGAEVGKIDIKSTNANGGSINLTGNVANSHNLAQLNVSSAAGKITQFDNTTLKSEVVNLTAKDDIKNIHIASIGKVVGTDAEGKAIVEDNIKLSAVSTGKGDIDVTAVGGLLENQSLPGNVEIVALKSQGGGVDIKNAALGDVTLTANGNIIQSGNGITVEGRGINLTSKNGGIGTSDQAIQIAGSDLVYATDRYGAQVNASAKDSIYLTEAAAGGNMRVGKIESKEGDVKLTVENGAFIDGLPGTDKSGSLESVDEMVHRWIDAGLIDGEKDAQGNYTYKGAYITGLEKARDDYAADVTAAYDSEKGGKTATEWRAEYTEQKNAYQSYLDKKAHHDGLSQADRQELEKNHDADYAAYKHYSQYGSYDTADDFLKANSTAYKYAQYDSAAQYLEADATYQKLADAAKPENIKFEWTKDMMLYAVSDALVNPASGSSTQTDGPANVLGRNVTLTSTQGAVGNISDTSTTITVAELTGENKIEKMKELMSVGAADVKVKRDDSGDLTEFVITPNMPLGVKAGGTLDVQAGGNVSVAGRTDTAGEHSAINVGTINATQNGATGDVRLYSDQGIYNALDANQTNITGHDLLLKGGKESIGAEEKPLTVFLTGDLTEAQADKNVFIKNMRDDYLRLGAMYAADTISLTSDKGFLMSGANASIADSFINAGKKLEFNTNPTTGIVGDADHAIRILNDRATVNIAAKSAYIKGMDSLSLGVRNGTLTLGDVTIQDDFTVASEGKIAQTETGKIVADNVTTISDETLILENEGNRFNTITVNGHKPKAGEDPAAIAGDVRIRNDSDALTVAVTRDVAGNIAVANRGDLTQKANTTLSVSEGKEVTLTSTEGAVAQDISSGTTGIQAKTVTVTSATGVNLQGTGNTFDSITVQSADATQPIAGDVSVVDRAEKLTISGRQAAADGEISGIAATSNIAVTNSVGDVFINSDVSTGDLGPSSLDDLANPAAYNSLTITAGGAIQEAAGVNITTPVVETYSGKGVSLESEKNEFAVFLADDFDGSGIDGSVKAVTSASSDDGNVFSVGVGADIYGDAEFTNLHENGEIGILISDTEDDQIDVLGGNGAQGDLVLKANSDITLLGDTNAAHDIVIDSANGQFFGIGEGMRAGNDITVSTGAGATYVGTDDKGMTAGNDIKVSATEGDIFIGAYNDTGEKTLEADNNITVETGLGAIHILGKTSTTNGDITMKAGQEDYTSGWDTGNFIIASDGALVSGGEITLNGRNGDVLITEHIDAKKGITVDIAGQGNVSFGTDVTVTNDVNISTEKGSITVGHAVTSDSGNVNMTTGEGDIAVDKAVTAAQDLAITTGKGNIDIGDNGPNVPTVTAKQNATVGTELGIVTIYGKTEAQEGDVTLYAGSDNYNKDEHTIVIDQNGLVVAGRDVNLGALNDDILVTEKIQAGRDVTGAVTGKGRIFFPGDEVHSENEINVAMENGDFILNRADGKRVSIWMENNSDLSYLGEILADANGAATPDVTLTGNYITVGSIVKKDGGSTFTVSTTGARGQKYIAEEITVDSLRSDTGTQTPSLWSNRGYVHIDEGAMNITDVLAGDKIHLENDQTTLAVYGRIPTKDGEQLVYWNNVGMANSKTRGFNLFTDGKVRTRKAVLVDSGRFYGKLMGDNLSVVDMMRDRVTHERGEYTFDSAQLTEPGRLLREPVLFGVEGTDVIIQQQSASDEEIVVES